MKKVISLIAATALVLTGLSITVSARRGEGIGNNLTLGKITFVMVDSENPQNILATFTTEEPIGRLRAVSEWNVPGFRFDRRTFRNAVRAQRGSQTITVPMVRNVELENVNFVVQ